MDEDKKFKARLDQLQQQKELLKKAKSRTGQKPTQAMRRSRAQLQEQFFAGSLNAKMMALMNQHHMRTTFIGEAYPPSIEPISSLTSILLHDLKLETHHRGRVLIVKTFCEPIRISSIQNAVEDVQGSVDRLSVYNLPSASPMDKVLPKGAIVAVKEPYFKATADGSVMVRVDHPSDFVLLEPHDSLVPPQWRKGPKAARAMFQLKEEGNTAFKRGHWQEAGECYTKALAKADNHTDLRQTLHRNRAQVCLNLGQYQFASEDAVASVIAGDDTPHQAKMLNVKSYFRAGRAQYQLGNFDLAREYLDEALRLDPTDDTVKADLTRTKLRILEQQKGDYNFAAMAQNATASHKKLDHATFTSNTKIAPAGKRGRGLVAIKNIKHGDLVMVEKAFCVRFGDELGKEYSLLININTDRVEYGTHAECLYKTIDKLRRNPDQASKFFDLFDGDRFKGDKVRNLDGVVVLDVFQVQAITELNGFGCPSIRSSIDEEEKRGGESSGIWLRASYMNHSCLPNTKRAFIGDMMIVRAVRDIKAGEEILTSYQPASTSFPKRKEKLSLWGFQCDCPLCQLEKKLPASVFAARDRIVQEARGFIAANPRTQANFGQPVSAAKIAQGKDILRRLESNYEMPMYETFPRLDCVSLDLWLVQASLSALQAGLSPTLDIAATTRLMQDLGYRVKVKNSEASIDRTNGVVHPEVVHAAMYSQEAWRGAGKPKAARAFVELAKEVYLAICGAMDGFEETFGDL
ncbi:hypothetical protein INS49_012058 [Diaporthe citri]|uniref:uncharacterized protein n=1 Tax=Diaporthe citri TaxID=83186 RepID=UPI001C807A7C|nr:uncharacterized protein INS49_012058 [Diaporthe citri]KAG6358541.1 hypothetical protein INS49_012058 [Diaporthe citri]